MKIILFKISANKKYYSFVELLRIFRCHQFKINFIISVVFLELEEFVVSTEILRSFDWQSSQRLFNKIYIDSTSVVTIGLILSLPKRFTRYCIRKPRKQAWVVLPNRHSMFISFKMSIWNRFYAKFVYNRTKKGIKTQKNGFSRETDETLVLKSKTRKNHIVKLIYTMKIRLQRWLTVW